MPTISDAALRILHVEDDRCYARLVRASLTKCASMPLELVLAECNETAVQQLQEATFDAVLADLSLPDSDGLETCAALRSAAPDVPIVVLTGHDDDALATAALEAGAEDYLVKGSTDGTGVLRALRFAIERTRRATDPLPTRSREINNPPRILIVEDHPGEALLLEESLADLGDGGFESVCVGRLGAALERLQSEAFDLVLLDLSLPDSRGVETCVALRREAPGVPFIVHTGSDDDGLALKTVQHGASDYLVKGRTAGKALVRSIRFAIQRQNHSLIFHSSKVTQLVAAHSAPNVELNTMSPLANVARADRPAARTTFDTKPTAERRRHSRYSLVRSVLAIPICPDGRPDWQNRLPGITFDLGRKGIGLELDTDRALESRALVVGVERSDGMLCFAGVEAVHVRQVGPRRLRVGGRLGGRGEDLLAPAKLNPTIELTSMRIVHGVSDELLAAWSQIGVVRPVLLDWLQVCPQCRGLPSFRAGCRSCGSGRMASTQLIHHFACAHVAPVGDFEGPEGLVCPKCRTRRIVVGANFEYQAGPSRCQDCHWSGTDVQQVGQCLRCAFRFPAHQALALEMIGYHVQRLDPLAFISAP